MKKFLLTMGAALLISSAVFAEPAADPSKEPAKPADPNSIACAVMTDHKVKVTKATEQKKFADYKENRYYFCCGGCIGAFKKDPEKYGKNAHLPVPKTPAAKPTEETPEAPKS